MMDIGDNAGPTWLLEENSTEEVAFSVDEFLYMDNIIEEILFDDAIEFMWLIRSGQMPLEELYNVKPLILNSKENEDISKKRSVVPYEVNAPSSSSSSSNWMSKTVICQICKENVAGVRYAPHLERCMNGGKRGIRRHYEYLHDTSLSLPYYSSKPKAKKEFIDPHPTSLILKFKVKNGAIIGPVHRHGAPIEEFESTQKDFNEAVKKGLRPAGARNFYSSNSTG